MMSSGRLVALGGGRLALLSVPLTVDVGLIDVVFCGSEMVRIDGTRRGISPCGGKAEAAAKGD
jgi:hypothetical protein